MDLKDLRKKGMRIDAVVKKGKEITFKLKRSDDGKGAKRIRVFRIIEGGKNASRCDEVS